MEETGKIQKLVESAGNYVDSSVDILKLQTAEKISGIVASVISDFLLILVGILFLLFVSLGLAYYLSEVVGNSYAGFLIVGGIYLLIVFVLIMMKSNGMELFFRNRIIRKMFDTEDEKSRTL